MQVIKCMQISMRITRCPLVLLANFNITRVSEYSHQKVSPNADPEVLKNKPGLEIATNTVAFVTEIFPFAAKISGEVANLKLVFKFALSKQKG